METTINGVDTKVVVQELSIKKIKFALNEFNKLGAEVKAKFSDIEKQDNMAIAMIIADNIEELADIVAIFVGDEKVTGEVLIDLGANSLLDLVIAVLEANNLAGIIEKIKKIQALIPQNLLKLNKPAEVPAPQEATQTNG